MRSKDSRDLLIFDRAQTEETTDSLTALSFALGQTRQPKPNGGRDTDRRRIHVAGHSAQRHCLHFNAGLSLPTGSIDKQDATPMGPNSKLPYPVQLGSGTYDLLPGLTYNGQDRDLSWGAQSSQRNHLE